MNNGKKFELLFKKSVPDDIFYLRLKDGTANWSHNELTRFQNFNVCDCVIFDGQKLALVELKTHKGKSFPLNCIRESQMKELINYEKFKNIKCCIVIYFSDLEECYCLFIWQIREFIRKNNRKSIPINYCRQNGLRIEQKKLKINYKFNIKKFMNEI